MFWTAGSFSDLATCIRILGFVSTVPKLANRFPTEGMVRWQGWSVFKLPTDSTMITEGMKNTHKQFQKQGQQSLPCHAACIDKPHGHAQRTCGIYTEHAQSVCVTWDTHTFRQELCMSAGKTYWEIASLQHTVVFLGFDKDEWEKLHQDSNILVQIIHVQN